MIKKWQLTHAPASRDQLRHKLSLDCEMKDVFFLMKKLGASCSRPEKESGEYAYSVYLLKADQNLISKAKEIVESMSEKKPQIPQPETPAQAKPAASEPPQQADLPVSDKVKYAGDIKQPQGQELSGTSAQTGKSEDDIKPQQAKERQEPEKLTEILPATEPEKTFKEPDKIEREKTQEIKKQDTASDKSGQAAPQKPQPPKPQTPNFSSLPEIDLDALKAPGTAIEPKSQEKTVIPENKPAPQPDVRPPASAAPKPLPKPSAVPSSAPPSFAPPSSSIRAKQDEEKKEKEKQEEAKKAESTRQIKKEVSIRTKSKWPIELPLNPTLSFQTLIAGPHNRFAHAAAMAVVENPGVMYNPLLIFGPQGIGKSHFIHAIGYGLSSSIGQNNIFVTHAVKFSKGIDLAIEQNTIDSLESMLKEIKVIIIDDIDLLSVTDKNRPYISRILNECIDSNKQIILSSMFPPKSLAPLEESIGFQFTQGWMVDIKVPNAQTYRLILNQMLSAIDLKISEDDIKTLFMSKMMDFRNVAKILSKAKKLEKYLSSIDSSLIHRDFISILLGASGDDETFPTDDEVSSAQIDSSVKDQWFKWGVFYPKGFKNHAVYALANMKFFASSELKIDLVWEQVFFEEYDPDEIYGIPFKIGETAAASQANGIIVLGPQSTSALGAKEAEFRTLTEKIIESFSLKAAWLDSSRLKAKSNYLKAIMELL